MSRTAALSALTLASALLLTGPSCLSKTEEEPDGALPPAELMAGQLELEEFPVNAAGIAGLGPLCRLVYSCGCPLLSPDDLDWCHETVETYTEEFCESMLNSQIPECLE